MIGGGAVLFAASGLAGTAILPLLGDIQMSIFTQKSILRSIWLGWTGWLGWGSDGKELLCSSILQVRLV